MSRLLNVIYSGSSCWAHLKEERIERRSKKSVKAECYQPTFFLLVCVCFVLWVVFVLSFPVNTEITTLLLLRSVWRLMCVKNHTPRSSKKKKKPFARGAQSAINCLSGAAVGLMDRIRLQVQRFYLHTHQNDCGSYNTPL